MTLTVAQLIEQLKICNQDDYVYLTTDATDWSNQEFQSATEIVKDCMYNPEADEFQDKIYESASDFDRDDMENYTWRDLKSHCIKCVVIC